MVPFSTSARSTPVLRPHKIVFGSAYFFSQISIRRPRIFPYPTESNVMSDVMLSRMKCSPRRAFTLIELLVTIAIVGLLLSMTVPALQGARKQAKRSACSSNLKQVGIGFTAYLTNNRDLLPHASLLPSIDPFPVSFDEPIYFADVLAEEMGDAFGQVLRCPSDQPGQTRREDPNTERSYYETERSSYEYRSRMGGYTMHVLINVFRRWVDESAAENALWLVRDYDNFHGKSGESGSRNYLYIDGHVADFEKH